MCKILPVGVCLVMVVWLKPTSLMMESISSMSPGWVMSIVREAMSFLICIPRKSFTEPWSSRVHVVEREALTELMVVSSFAKINVSSV